MTDAEKIDLLQNTLEWVLRDVRAWCEAVEEDSSWDGWDYHYKSFMNRNWDGSGFNFPSNLEQAESVLESTREDRN